MSGRLKDLIKKVRNAKTAADEREIVANELAAIRGAFRKADKDSEVRQRCMAKLLYLHTLGYSTSFAQMECLKLIVSSYYSDKRIGYLGLMILLDEKQEVLMLVTNSLKADLSHANVFVVGLALAALSNIGSEEMCRECGPEVEKLLGKAGNPYLRKKAGCAAMRTLRKAPDMAGNFGSLAMGMVGERNHGVVLVGASLLVQVVQLEEQEHAALNGEDAPTEEGSLLTPGNIATLTRQSVKALKALTVSGYAPEFDVQGVTDPFLQVGLLKLMAVLGARSFAAAEAMNDILAQVATNTESSRNVGNAILYQSVRTILAIKSDGNLKVLAINVLAKFLKQRDNNIRYVALNLLGKAVRAGQVEVAAVQRHRNTIVDCLKDPDVSIRRRALDLIYTLVNPSNVRVLVRELLNFLLLSDPAFRPDLTAKLCAVAERHAPSRLWYLDTVLRIMDLAGAYVPDQVTSSLVFMIASTDRLHEYAVRKMYSVLVADPHGGSAPLEPSSISVHDKPPSFVRACVWVMGEFADVLVHGSTAGLAGGAVGLDQEGLPPRPSHAEVFAVLEALAKGLEGTVGTSNAGSSGGASSNNDGTSAADPSTAANSLTLGYVAAAMAKALARLGGCPEVDLAARLHRYASYVDVDVAQRSVEFVHVLKGGNALSGEVLDRMPVPEGEGGEVELGEVPSPSSSAAATAGTAPATAGSISLNTVNLLDLDIDDDEPEATPPPPSSSGMDGLMDLHMGGGGAGGAGAMASTTTAQVTHSLDLLGLGSGTPAAGIPASSDSSNTGMGGSLLDLGGPAPVASSAPATSGAPSAGNALDDIFGSVPTPTASAFTPPPLNPASQFVGFHVRDTIHCVFDAQRHPTTPGLVMYRANLRNSSGVAVDGVKLLLAVPKYCQIKLEPASGGTELAPLGASVISQVAKVANAAAAQGKPILLKARVEVGSLGWVETVDVAIPKEWA